MKKVFLPATVVALIAVALAALGLIADDHHDKPEFQFQPDTLVITRSVYTGVADTVTVGEVLPPGCQPGTLSLPNIPSVGGFTSVKVAASVCLKSGAVDNGLFPFTYNAPHNVWNNDAADGSFGVSSPIFLDNVATDGKLLDTLAVDPTQIVTSFSSKSELALHRSVDGKSLTFMGYRGGPGCPSLILNKATGALPEGAANPSSVTNENVLDVSSSNTPGLCDPSDPSIGSYYRSVAEVDSHGNIQFTEGNAYSGDNSRSVIKAGWMYYVAGNDNNGKAVPGAGTPNNTVVGVNLVNDTGVELLIPGQTPPVPPANLKIGDFEVTQLGDPADKAGKDNNFRGMTIYHNTLYVTKGSGGNGINTVYQVGCAGELPTVANAPGYCAPAGTPANLLHVPITILPGFSTTLASSTTGTITYPFGLWFADDHTLYVCDEGDGTFVSPPPASGNVATPLAQTTAGVQKWRLIGGTWVLQYVLNNGLNIGVPYSVANYPASLNPATGGCRNMTGRHNGDGTVTIYAVTATLSANGDQGADPNEIVKVTDLLKASTLPTGDGDHDRDDRFGHFTVVRPPVAGDVYRGVTWAPKDNGDDDDRDDHDWHFGH